MSEPAGTAVEGEWITVHAQRALYVDHGKTAVLCDRLPSPVVLVIKLGSAPEATGHQTKLVPSPVQGTKP